MTKALEMWVLYKNPTDFPKHYVARKWDITAGANVPTDERILAQTLEGLRTLVKIKMGGAPVCIPRSPIDDLVIVETWI